MRHDLFSFVLLWSVIFESGATVAMHCNLHADFVCVTHACMAAFWTFLGKSAPMMALDGSPLQVVGVATVKLARTDGVVASPRIQVSAYVVDSLSVVNTNVSFLLYSHTNLSCRANVTVTDLITFASLISQFFPYFLCFPPPTSIFSSPLILSFLNKFSVKPSLSQTRALECMSPLKRSTVRPSYHV